MQGGQLGEGKFGSGQLAQKPVLAAVSAAPASGDAIWRSVALEQALLQASIDRGDFDDRAFDAALLLDLQQALCRRELPHLGGWRVIGLQLPGGQLLPPLPAMAERVDAHLRPFTRLQRLIKGTEPLIEWLAQLEGGLHAMYPFSNLCEPTIRLLLRIYLRRLGRPGAWLDRDTTPLYLQALQAGRLRHWSWLVPVWRLRLDWHSTKVTALPRRR